VQARRTGTSSPLGQLFDHGCDALATPLLMLVTSLAFGGGLGPLTAALIAGTMAVFYLAQWEEGITGVLRTNVGGFGVTEAQVRRWTPSRLPPRGGFRCGPRISPGRPPPPPRPPMSDSVALVHPHRVRPRPPPPAPIGMPT
jgi:hypothetical protein